jgi:hypothetical protein
MHDLVCPGITCKRRWRGKYCADEQKENLTGRTDNEELDVKD